MKPEQQNKIIAEYCGWTYDDKVNKWIHSHKPAQRWAMDYCGDLNLMHEAEHHLSYEERKQYCMTLCDMTGSDWGLSDAATRASAFLITIGKWKDEQ